MTHRIWMAACSLIAIGASAQTTHYTLTDLGSVGGAPGQPFSITNTNLVAGAALRTDGTLHAMLWYKGARTDLGTLGLRISNSLAFSANDNGQIVGMADTFTTYPYREDFCGFKVSGLPTWGTECLPFIWQNGIMAPLPTLGGYNGMASWINNKGQVVGAAETAVRDTTCPSPQVLQSRPVLWDSGKAQELPTAAGDPSGIAIAINDSGQIVGASGTCAAWDPTLLTGLHPVHALMWQNGKATDLGNLGGTAKGPGNIALALNSHGQVVGNSGVAGDQALHAFLWTESAGMQDLGTLPGDVISAGININAAGTVIGVSIDATGNLRAYQWQKGVMSDLNALIPANSPLYLLLPCSINTAGQIVGLAVAPADGSLHAFQLTPSDSVTPATVVAAPPVLTEAARAQLARQLRLRGVAIQ